MNSHFNAFLRTFIYWTYKLSYIICKHNTSEIINRKWVGISRQQPIIKTKNKTMKKIVPQIRLELTPAIPGRRGF